MPLESLATNSSRFRRITRRIVFWTGLAATVFSNGCYITFGAGSYHYEQGSRKTAPDTYPYDTPFGRSQEERAYPFYTIEHQVQSGAIIHEHPGYHHHSVGPTHHEDMPHKKPWTR